MCGRFVSASPPDELARYFEAEPPAHELEANYNVAPTDQVYIVRASEGHRQLTEVTWGLVPFWAKERKIGSRLINARSESVLEKPAFRNAIKRHRCLIPADGFYEWAKVAGHKRKQPYFIERADDELLVFAGLWERWRPPVDDDAVVERDGDGRPVPLLTCTVLTTAANEAMSTIHDRMPVLLPPSAWDNWLADSNEPDDVIDLLQPAPEGLLVLRPVTTAVNYVRNNGPQLLDPDPDPLTPSIDE